MRPEWTSASLLCIPELSAIMFHLPILSSRYFLLKPQSLSLIQTTTYPLLTKVWLLGITLFNYSQLCLFQKKIPACMVYFFYISHQPQTPFSTIPQLSSWETTPSIPWLICPQICSLPFPWSSLYFRSTDPYKLHFPSPSACWFPRGLSEWETVTVEEGREKEAGHFSLSLSAWVMSPALGRWGAGGLLHSFSSCGSCFHQMDLTPEFWERRFFLPLSL